MSLTRSLLTTSSATSTRALSSLRASQPIHQRLRHKPTTTTYTSTRTFTRSTAASNMANPRPITLQGGPLHFKPGAASGKPGVPNMAGKRIVVVGGSGGVGSHIVDRCCAAGAAVVIGSRTAGKGNVALKDAQARNPGKDITVLVGDTGTYDGAAAFAAKARAAGTVDHVVCSIGGWWSGQPLWDAPADALRRFFSDIPTAYIANLHAWGPHLPAGHAIVWILGASGLVPVPGSGPVCMGSASLIMAHQVVEREHAMMGTKWRLFSLVMGAMNTRQRGAAHGGPQLVDADEMADVALALMERQDVPTQGLTMQSREQLKVFDKQLGITPKR